MKYFTRELSAILALVPLVATGCAMKHGPKSLAATPSPPVVGMAQVSLPSESFNPVAIGRTYEGRNEEFATIPAERLRFLEQRWPTTQSCSFG